MGNYHILGLAEAVSEDPLATECTQLFESKTLAV
jgi:hypothetical protein